MEAEFGLAGAPEIVHSVLRGAPCEPKAVRGKRRPRRVPDLGQQAGRWWGDLYELCPDGLLDELNGEADYQKITALLKCYRAQKR
jgi:hypothetical protein